MNLEPSIQSEVSQKRENKVYFDRHRNQSVCSVMSSSLWPHGLQNARLPCPSLTPGACSDSCPSSRWCHPTISSSVSPSPLSENHQLRERQIDTLPSWADVCMLSRFSQVLLFATLWTIARQGVRGILQARIPEWVAVPSSGWCVQDQSLWKG